MAALAARSRFSHFLSNFVVDLAGLGHFLAGWYQVNFLRLTICFCLDYALAISVVKCGHVFLLYFSVCQTASKNSCCCKALFSFLLCRKKNVKNFFHIHEWCFHWNFMSFCNYHLHNHHHLILILALTFEAFEFITCKVPSLATCYQTLVPDDNLTRAYE